MRLTVADLLTSQLRLIGAVEPGETPEASELNDALQANNIMLDNWSARTLLVRAAVQETFQLVPNKAAYTIGVGADFNTSKPVMVLGAFIRDTGANDIPLEIMTFDQFDALPDKSISVGMPEALYYDPGLAQQAVQTGTIKIYQTPDRVYTLFLEQQKYLKEFVNLADVVTFEPAYLRAIKFNGAMEYYYEYRKHTQMIPPGIKRIASESLNIVENMNGQLRVMGFDIPNAGRGRWNVMTDGFF